MSISLFQAPSLDLPLEKSDFAKSILARAQLQLRRSGYLELQNVDCLLQDKTLVLSGRVSSYYMLQMAQALTSGLPGVDGIDNRLEVQAVPRFADLCG